MTIKDNGIGFNLTKSENSKEHRHGIGLSTMEERARLLSGEFQIASQPGQGTTITLIIPVQPNKSPAKKTGRKLAHFKQTRINGGEKRQGLISRSLGIRTL